MTSACHFFKVSRQAYYKHRRVRANEQASEQRIKAMVDEVRRSNQRMGGRKLYKLLGDRIVKIHPSMGRDKFFNFLGRHQLLIRRRRKYARTTQSFHRFRVYENKLKSLPLRRAHQAWVCDITYLRRSDGFVYLFLITDAYSRKIVGWQLSESLATEAAIRALKEAIKQCRDTRGLIHHSDRGFQYCSTQYVKLLEQNGIEISMAEAGNCYENAIAERVNGILKDEYGLDQTFADKREALQATRQAIYSYNNERPHWSLELEIPAKVHAA